MEYQPDTPANDPGHAVRLGRATNEATAHIIAQAIENAGYRVRVAGFETIASQIVPGSSQFTIEVLVLEGDYDNARAILEQAMIGDLAVDTKNRCVICRYDMTGAVSAICPECGTDLEALGGVRRSFLIDPPPGDHSLLRNPGAMLGLLVLLMLPVSCVGYALYELIATLIEEL